MPEVAITDSVRVLSPEYEWQKARLKTSDRRAPAGCLLTRGYGPTGEYSLYLPSPRIERRITFVDGSPTVALVGSCLEIPEIKAARDSVMECAAKRMTLAQIFADVILIKYSAALLTLNYALTDDDLSLLHSGRRWYEPIIRHALGGEDAIDALRQLDAAALTEMWIESERALTVATAAANGRSLRSSPRYVETGEVELSAASFQAAEVDTFDPTDL